MGINISKFPRLFTFSKSIDVYKKELEEINKEIVETEKNEAALWYQYHLITQFIVSYSRLLYLMVSLVFFFSTLPSTLVEYIFFCGPILVFHILLSGLKKSLKWYFDNEIKRNSKKLAKLYSRKKSILSEVKERVKFTDAKDIIEQYSPVTQSVMEEFQRWVKRSETVSYKRRESSLDHVVKYVFGEEKGNALICKSCKWNNGLALEEEFDKMSYHCSRCGFLNTPKKHKIKGIEPKHELLNPKMSEVLIKTVENYS